MKADELKQISDLAALFIPPERIARIMEMDTEDLKTSLLDPSSDIYKAYYTGYDKAEVEVRISVIKLAQQGSQPAQDQVKKYISELKSKLDE